MNRAEMIARLARDGKPWDMIVIGGGATGAGIAVDAASRGYSIALLEQSDFGKGTSSRSTKLVHGGVRYLQQGNISLVREALRERSILRRNAPHLVSNLPLIVPAYAQWERVYYGAGLMLYDLLAGRSGFGRSALLSRRTTLERLPAVKPEGLRGGILYHDGQFDDARLLINLIQTAAEQGAIVANYVRVRGLSRTGTRVDGVIATEEISGRELRLPARVVVNATGAFVDGVRQLAAPSAPPLVTPSQGTHIVLDGAFLGGRTALMVPRIGDGRVMFAIPWLGHALVGTTDTPIDAARLEPVPLRGEIDALLRTAGRYLRRAPALSDIRSVFTGVRPLVGRGDSKITAALSRDHTIRADMDGLITTTGGKWTTYRRMAEQTVDRAARAGGLPERRCTTENLRIHGYRAATHPSEPLTQYGADAPALERLRQDDPDLGQPLDAVLPCTGAQVVWAARHEMARTVEDVLARRCRALFLDAAAAVRMAPAVAALLAREFGEGLEWQNAQVRAFEDVAQHYSVTMTNPAQ